MIRHLSPLILFTIVFLVTVASVAHSANLLTDAELDALGAGGVGSVKQGEERDLNFLTDATLDAITAQGLHGTVWPFQYLPDRIPVFRGFLTWPIESEDVIGQSSTGLQFRGVPLVGNQGFPSNTTN